MRCALRGIIVNHEDGLLELAVGDVFHELKVSNQPFGVIGDQALVHVYDKPGDDPALYGFHSRQERKLALQLIKVDGVGPAAALKALTASGAPERLCDLINAGIEKDLVKFGGMGPKTAAKVILELKGKVGYVVDDGTLAKLILDVRQTLNSLGIDAFPSNPENSKLLKAVIEAEFRKLGTWPSTAVALNLFLHERRQST